MSTDEHSPAPQTPASSQAAEATSQALAISSQAAEASSQAAELVVSRSGAARWRDGHPWIYRSDLRSDRHAGSRAQPVQAAAVAVRDERGRRLGWADYSPHSEIALRRLSFDPRAEINRGFWRQRLLEAQVWRQRIVAGSEAFRLIAGDADGLPGLTVDAYGRALSFQITTAAMSARQPELIELLRELFSPDCLVARLDARVRLQEGLPLESRLILGESARVRARVNGLELEWDLLAGQKSGGYLDQRENWRAVASWVRPGMECLDVFTYQGGFALHLAAAGGRVEAVDLSRPALEHAERDAARNGLPEINWLEANAFDLLRDYDDQGRQFDLVVLDPPAFAKRRAALAAARRGYKEINLRALKLLRPGGILASCSCSHHLSEAELLELIAEAALDAHRRLRVLERRSQALDHPILLNVPETHYLKCLIFSVSDANY